MTPEEKKNIENENAKKLLAEQQNYAAITLEAFEKSEAGKKWFELTKEMFLYKHPVADPAKSDSFAYHREGQNSMLRLIEQQCNLAKSFAKEATKGAK